MEEESTTMERPTAQERCERFLLCLLLEKEEELIDDRPRNKKKSAGLTKVVCGVCGELCTVFCSGIELYKHCFGLVLCFIVLIPTNLALIFLIFFYFLIQSMRLRCDFLSHMSKRLFGN